MTVQAKFWVEGIHHAHTESKDSVFATVTMKPVYDDANKDWSKWTPQGKIEMSITNPFAVEQFALGEQYLITFEHAPKVKAV